MSNLVPSTDLIGEEFTDRMKYSEIVSANNDKLYLIPCNANTVLSFNVQTNEWKTVGLDDDDDYGSNPCKWWGGTFVTSNNKIYCCPCYSNDVLVVDTTFDTTELIRLPKEVQNNVIKYQTCAYDNNGHVFFFPQLTSKMIRIDINTHRISILDEVDCGNDWKSAVYCPSDGLIYCLSSDNYVGKFNPNNWSFVKIKLTIDNSWHGEQCTNLVQHTTNDCLYALPCKGTKVVRIDTNTLSSQTVGNDIGNKGLLKWRTAVVGHDDCLYGIPYDSPHVLKFDPSTNSTTIVGNEYNGYMKWYGGCLASDGNIYAVPSYAKKLLRITVVPSSRSWWDTVKDHVTLRRLVERGRASVAIIDSSDENETNVPSRSSLYRRFIQYSNDDVFYMILTFL